VLWVVAASWTARVDRCHDATKAARGSCCAGTLGAAAVFSQVGGACAPDRTRTYHQVLRAQPLADRAGPASVYTPSARLSRTRSSSVSRSGRGVDERQSRPSTEPPPKTPERCAARAGQWLSTVLRSGDTAVKLVSIRTSLKVAGPDRVSPVRLGEAASSSDWSVVAATSSTTLATTAPSGTSPGKSTSTILVEPPPSEDRRGDQRGLRYEEVSDRARWAV